MRHHARPARERRRPASRRAGRASSCGLARSPGPGWQALAWQFRWCLQGPGSWVPGERDQMLAQVPAPREQEVAGRLLEPARQRSRIV